jgi:hypothetical protein
MLLLDQTANSDKGLALVLTGVPLYSCGPGAPTNISKLGSGPETNCSSPKEFATFSA